ncbi:MAG: ATP synthase F1 subunit gamma [Acutalibacteraceae bacterium]
MSTVNEIKSHLKAVEQTKQITNAMYLLSTARMKSAMEHIDFNLYYLKRLKSTIKTVLSQTESSNIHDKFIDDSKRGSSVFVVITSDKGLCGSYNSAVVDLAMKEMAKHQDPIVVSLGIIGHSMFKKSGVPVGYSWYGASQHPTMNLAEQIASKLIPLYLTDDFHEVFIVYTEYVNSNIQKPVCVKLLPLEKETFESEKSDIPNSTDMIYEPSVEVVFEHLVEEYIVGFVYDVLMQSSASENIARMTAMQNATKNADEMIKELYSELNSARQLQITNEITEISAAVEMGGI